jgi:PASTA domain-containing protein
VCAGPVAGRIAGVMAAVALLASAVGFSAPPAAAGLTSGDSIPEVRVLPFHVIVIPDDPKDLGSEVMTFPVTLQAGQTRLISDQLTVTVTRDDAEVENILECVDPTGDRNVGVNAGGQPEAYGSGTNYTRGGGQLVMHGSLLFTAPHTGTFWCQVRAHTDAGNDHGYHLTAVAAPRPGGTWLAIDNFTGDAPLWWQINTCQSDGRVPKTPRTDPNCVFLGRPLGSHGHPVTATLHGWPPSTLDTPDVHLSDVWVAPSDATTASVAGHMQITSCFPGTASCPGSEQGASDIGPGGVVIVWDTAVFRTHLELVQLDPGGAPCAVASTPDTQYTITDAVHHFLVDYGPMTVAISPTCGGSRRFALHIVVSWVFGNAVKIDSGSVFGFRSATNANVIVRSTAPATTVPPLTGVDEGTAASRLAGRGLTVGTVTKVVDPARAGTVIASNSPAWTSEPAGSPVDLTISLGAVTVPDLEGDTTAQAVRELAAAGLAAHIEHTAQCLDPGHVIGQRPAAGTTVAPGSTVTITIDDGTSSNIICR